MEQFFEILRKYGLVSKRRVNAEKVASLSRVRILDVAHELATSVQQNELPPGPSAFNYSASLDLGGGAQVCREVTCRVSRIEQLARFAVLYADCVYCDNFFSHYAHYGED